MSKLCLLLFFCVCTFKTYAQVGSLDSTFGNNGIQTTTNLHFTSTVIQGYKIVAAGYALNENQSNDFALARYTNSGILDTSFGKNGITTSDFNNSDDRANAIVLQGDKILVAGYTGEDINREFALARYTTHGKLDSSFGVNGLVTTNFNVLDDVATSIALQGDKIIVAGSTSGADFALARYAANGTLDPSFGVNGKVTGPGGQATSITLQGDKIIVAGYDEVQTNNLYSRYVIARYRANGTLDASFGENGVVTAGFNGFTDGANAIALQGDKIIVAGSTGSAGIDFPEGTFNFALARYTADGKLDASFGVNGQLTTDFNNADDFASSIVLQEGKIIAAGSTGSFGNYNFALACYTADGLPDSSFGENGEVITDLSGDASIQGIAFHENRLYAVGHLAIGYTETYGVVAAYLLDTTKPAVSISISDITVQESQKQAVVTVSLSAPDTLPVRVSYTTKDKTAIDNQDYLSVKDTLLFNPGITTANITIPIIDDSLHENDEQFEVILTNALHATIQDSVAVVTIVDNDTVATRQDSSFHIAVSPNPSNGIFAVQVQGSDYNQPVSIRVFDMSGRLIDQRMNTTIGQSLRFGDSYMAGIYIIEARQGSQRTQTKVIKINK